MKLGACLCVMNSFRWGCLPCSHPCVCASFPLQRHFNASVGWFSYWRQCSGERSHTGVVSVALKHQRLTFLRVCVQADRSAGRLTGSMMELQTLQEALKVEIQIHQVCCGLSCFLSWPLASFSKFSVCMNALRQDTDEHSITQPASFTANT